MVATLMMQMIQAAGLAPAVLAEEVVSAEFELLQELTPC
jgi:hypothetical protein